MQPQAITHPADVKLCLKALLALARHAKRPAFEPCQARISLANRAAVQVGRYALGCQRMERMCRELKRLKTYFGRVYRDVGREVAVHQAPASW